jgi:hypothetical protein
MSELSFLVDLLVNHKLPKATSDVILARLKEVEVSLEASREIQFPIQPRAMAPGAPRQAASTQAILDRNPDLAAAIPIEQVAQTPAAMAAMASRSAAIAESMSGKVDKVTGRPRKF